MVTLFVWLFYSILFYVYASKLRHFIWALALFNDVQMCYNPTKNFRRAHAQSLFFTFFHLKWMTTTTDQYCTCSVLLLSFKTVACYSSHLMSLFSPFLPSLFSQSNCYCLPLSCRTFQISHVWVCVCCVAVHNSIAKLSFIKTFVNHFCSHSIWSNSSKASVITIFVMKECTI